MTAARVFQVTLLLVLWYFLAGLVFTRALGLWPDGFEGEGFFLVGAALPWSLLALDFYQPTDSVLGAAVRDVLFFAVVAIGIAANAAILDAALGVVARRLHLAQAIARQHRLAHKPRGMDDAAAASRRPGPRGR